MERRRWGGGAKKSEEEERIPNRAHDEEGATKDRRALDEGGKTPRTKEASPCKPLLFIGNMEGEPRVVGKVLAV